MNLFLELLTLVCTVLAGLHAWVVRREEGVWLFASLLLLGACRENWVVLEQLLYRYGSLHLKAGAAPAIGVVIWAYSIYAAVVWAETLGHSRAFLALVGVFMMALVGLYEPFLALVGMARWEAGTRVTAGVPWIALIGYPTLAVAFLWLFDGVRRGLPRPPARAAALLVSLPVLAVAHAYGLAQVKRLLGW
jgi:hypothetical protein